MRAASRIAAVVLLSGVLFAADDSPLAFDVVSIKRHIGEGGSSIRTLPDGTYMATDVSIASIIRLASTVSVPGHEVVGLPDWTQTERYDITAKPPEGLRPNPNLRPQMWQATFADRLKLSAHVEDRERDTYALVVARSCA